MGVPVEDQRASKRGQLVPQRRTAVWAVVPSLPSVSLIFSTQPARQESFVEGARVRAGWARVCVCVCTDPCTRPRTDRAWGRE